MRAARRVRTVDTMTTQQILTAHDVIERVRALGPVALGVHGARERASHTREEALQE